MQWLKFSALAIQAAKGTAQQNCIACYNAKRIPQLRALPASLVKCALYMASDGQAWQWSSDSRICPQVIENDDYNIADVLPPVVQRPNDMVLPLCIARGTELENVVNDVDKRITDPAGLVQCHEHLYGHTVTNGRTQVASIKLCKSDTIPHLKCAQVVPDGGQVISFMNNSYVDSYGIPHLEGTVPLGDIFWTCSDTTELLPQLPEDWEGLSAPVMLTGHLSVITQQFTDEQDTRAPHDQVTPDPKPSNTSKAK